MTFKSKIDTSTIDQDFPKLRQPNSVQGFRDNFTAIVENFSTAATEISRIENKSVYVQGDVVGTSSPIGDGDDPINLILNLTDTGVAAGTYEVSSITVDSKGRIIKITDASNVYLSQSGGVLSGDLILKDANIIVDQYSTIGGRNLKHDGHIIDQLNKQNGILVRQDDGIFTTRIFEATDGLKVINENGVKGPITYGIKGFNITFKGDVKGTARIKSLDDMIVTLKLDNESILSTSGGKMKGTLDLNDNYLKGIKQPIYGNHIGDRDYNDERYLRNTLGNATGFVVQRRVGTETMPREIKGHNGIHVHNGDGFDGNPIISANDFTIKLQGDVVGSCIVTGLGSTVIDTSLPNHYSKDEADKIFLNKMDNIIDSDLTVTGNVTIKGLVQGRDLQKDGLVLDALTSNNGFVVSYNGTISAKAFTGTSRQLDIVYGDNVVIKLSDNPIIPGNDGLTLPKGKTSDRTDGDGKVRYNTDTFSLETSQSGAWNRIQTSSFGNMHSDSTIVWMMNNTRTMFLQLQKDANISAHGFVAGETYVLIIQNMANYTVTFDQMFKFADGDELSSENATDIVEFFCDGTFLYGIIKNNFK